MQEKLLAAFDKVKDFVITHKKLSIGVCVGVFVLLLLYVFSIFYTYTDYTIKYETSMEDSEGTAYESFHNNIVKYNSDGAFLVTKGGELIWNESFDMSSPSIDIADDYLALYDRFGTKVCVMNDTGKRGEVSISGPILKACVADNGSVAALINERDVSFIEIRSLDGELIARGELHIESSGIPATIAFSRDGERLCVSSVSVQSGNLQTVISFYDFSSSGRDRKDNLVGTFSFADIVMPRIVFMSNGNLVAFGDREIALFNDSFEPKLKKEIFPSGSIDSIFYNQDHFGYIGPEVDSDGRTIKMLYTFGESGFSRLEKEIDDSYTNVYMLSSDDIVMLTEKVMILAGSPDGFSNSLDDTNEVEASAALSRQSSVWGDEEEY